jgi:hypothetical protein
MEEKVRGTGARRGVGKREKREKKKTTREKKKTTLKNSLSVTTVTLGSRLFFLILLQIN